MSGLLLDKAIALGGGEDLEQEGVVPAQQIEGEAAQPAEVFGSVLEHPVELVFDRRSGCRDTILRRSR
jgi:hypothetical protein